MRVRIMVVVGATVAALGAYAASASASAAHGAPCGATPVFAQLGDTANYIRMNAVDGARRERSGRTTLAGGATAVFKGYCIAYFRPQIRLVAVNTGNPSATLTVSVQYRDWRGRGHDDTLATLSGFSTPQVSDPLPFDGSNAKGNIQVTLTASADANWVIYGVYLDPRMSN